jgi:hypothetical protein
MGRDVCRTCGQSVRDFDEQPVGAVTALPAHGCASPVGDFPWNDGRHVVTDDEQRWTPLGPATRSDLAELDAVPEPVDSDAPRALHPPGCAPIGLSAETKPYRRPRRDTMTSWTGGNDGGGPA